MPVLFFTEVRAMLVLALPLIIAQVAQTSLSLIDTLMVSRLHETALASLGIGATLYHMGILLVGGVIMAVGPTVSQAYGANNPDEIARATRQGLWLSLAIGAPVVIILQFSEPIFTFLRQDPLVSKDASAYVRVMAWGFVPNIALFALRGMLEGISRPRLILWVVLCGLCANIFFNSCFIFGRLGFPALGLVGAGWASTLVYWLMFIVAAGIIYTHFGHYGVFRHFRKPDPDMLRSLLRIGIPIGLTLGFEVGMFAAMTFLMGWFGVTALAAHQITLQVMSLSFMVPLGIAMAASVRVGQAIGRQDIAGARLAGYVGLALGLLFMCAMGLLYTLRPDWIIQFFKDLGDPANLATIQMARGFFLIGGLFQLADGAQVCLSGALRGLKDTRIPMLMAGFSYWAIGMTCAYFAAFHWGLEGQGLWLGLLVGLSMAAVLMGIRFNHLTKNPLTLATNSSP